MSRLVVAILLVLMIAVPNIAAAGDEVDYSAPYLVVEDGKLVTKYPGQEHQGDSPQQQDSVVAAVIAVVILLLLVFARRTRRQ